MNYNKEAKVSTTVAEEITELASKVNHFATETADNVDDKLHPVTMPELPKEEVSVDSAIPDYPPLFAKLYAELTAIERALVRINKTLNKCEL